MKTLGLCLPGNWFISPSVLSDNSPRECVLDLSILFSHFPSALWKHYSTLYWPTRCLLRNLFMILSVFPKYNVFFFSGKFFESDYCCIEWYFPGITITSEYISVKEKQNVFKTEQSFKGRLNSTYWAYVFCFLLCSPSNL